MALFSKCARWINLGVKNRVFLSRPISRLNSQKSQTKIFLNSESQTVFGCKYTKEGARCISNGAQFNFDSDKENSSFSKNGTFAVLSAFGKFKKRLTEKKLRLNFLL